MATCVREALPPCVINRWPRRWAWAVFWCMSHSLVVTQDASLKIGAGWGHSSVIALAPVEIHLFFLLSVLQFLKWSCLPLSVLQGNSFKVFFPQPLFLFVWIPSSDNLYQMASPLECMAWNPVNTLASTIKRYVNVTHSCHLRNSSSLGISSHSSLRWPENSKIAVGLDSSYLLNQPFD